MYYYTVLHRSLKKYTNQIEKKKYRIDEYSWNVNGLNAIWKLVADSCLSSCYNFKFQGH